MGSPMKSLFWKRLIICSMTLGSAFVTWHPAHQHECEFTGCDTAANRLCSYSFGFKYDSRFENASCVFANITGFKPYLAPDVVNSLLNNSVLAFVGDSIIRSLFVSMMIFLGHDFYKWYNDLLHLSLLWKESKLDHVYLCSPPLGPTNLTIAFLWRPNFG